MKRIRIFVKEAVLLEGGNSIFPPYHPLGCKWELTLVDGRVVERPVKYKKGAKVIFHPNRKSSTDALPAPSYVYVKTKGDK